MRPWRAVAPTACALALTLGCAKPAPIVWNRAGATSAEFSKDQYECERDAELVGGGQAARMQLPLAYFVASIKEMNAFYRKCMGSKGWVAEGS